MATQFLYRHGASGYNLHGVINDPSLRQSLLKYLESERFDPHRAANTSIWRWIRVDTETRAILNISLRTATSGKSVIEMRGILLDTSDCDAIRWNPFRLAAMFDDDKLWQLERIVSTRTADIRRYLKDKSSRDGSPALRKSPKQWQVVVNDLGELVSWMDLLDGKHRKDVEVEATTDQKETGRRVFIRSSSKPPVRSEHGRQRWKPALIVTVIAFVMLLIAGVRIWNVQVERDHLETVVTEREQWLHDREIRLDQLQSEHDELRRQHAYEREELRRQLRQLAAFGRDAAGLRQTVLADVRRRRSHVEHYLDQAILKEALEAWIDLERTYGITEERIRDIKREVSNVIILVQELNDELRRAQRFEERVREIDDTTRQRIREAADRVEEAVRSMLRLLDDRTNEDR